MSILRFSDYITEADDIKYSYGIVMGTLNLPNWKDILDEIDEDDLANGYNQKGLEDFPHITLLSGLHDDVDMKEVGKIFDKISHINIEIVDVSLFENDDFDVVKFGIESNELLILHEWLKYSFEYTSDFPDYHAHATIAYVKSGEGKKYIKTLTDIFLKEPISIKLDELIIRNSDNKEVKLNLGK